MAEEFRLSHTANEIDRRLNMMDNAILFTEQSLTEEQKAQARINIGIMPKGESEETPTIEEATYVYDGNMDNEDAVWVYNYYKTAKVFYKAGDIPENCEVNLVGGHVNVTVPSNYYLDYSFEITEEMLEASVDYSGWIISAKVDGLTQILYQNAGTNDVAPIAVVIICTKAGNYNISFNGWGEELTFVEKGIYLLDNRGFGGNKYVSSLSCTIIESSNPSTDLSSPIDYNGKEIQVFNKGICIGDSITEGVFNHSAGEAIIKDRSYPKLLQRMTNIEVVNAGVAGLTSKTWYEASLNSEAQYGRWVNNEWVWSTVVENTEGLTVSTALDYSGYDFAIIHLGINDLGMMGNATLEATIATFETNINNIISKLKTANAGIKIFLCTIIPCYAVSGNTAYEMLNDKIREIAEATIDVFLIDLNKYSDCADGTPYENQHLTAIGYHKMASEIAALISYAIHQNLDEFKTVQFIGTDYII